jgi:Xaa-Pro aminopeptidase
MKITAAEYKNRRDRLASNLSNNSIVVLESAPVFIRNGDVEHAYRQDSYFYYLTGFCEPDSVTVLIKEHDRYDFILFSQKRDPKVEKWVGKKAGQEGAVNRFGADRGYDINEIDQIMPKLLDKKDIVHRLMGHTHSLDVKLNVWLSLLQKMTRQGAVLPKKFYALNSTLNEMQQVAEISAQAHRNAMLKSVSLMSGGVKAYEYQLESVITSTCLDHGSKRQAYPSIVAGGENACVLHYIENDQEIKKGALVLIDAGGELDYYAADITRTFPASGVFSDEQKILYQIVLDAQKAAINEVVIGNNWDQPHQAALHVLVQGLVDIGILTGDVSTLIDDQAYLPFYMHKTGHWLGVDVHDVGEYRDELGQWRLFREGMVLTIEPGLYIDPEDENVDERWKGIGIRIEDDVVVTSQLAHVLSSSVPKEIAEIEALMQSTLNGRISS